MSVFKKATRKQSKLRLALIGPSGSGKTMSALLIAKSLGKRVAVIDSERGSASLYAGDAGEFDVLELEDFAPQKYIDAIKAAEREGYDVIVVDSLSHAWMGKGGALEMVDQAAKRSASKNSFDAWRAVTPAHNALVDAMVQSKSHIIATVRSKTEYVLEENDRGKKVPRKVGMAPVQRDGLEYEFTLVGEMDQEHNLVVSKTRCNLVDGQVINKPGAQLAETLKAWLDSGAPEVAYVNASPADAPRLNDRHGMVPVDADPRSPEVRDAVNAALRSAGHPQHVLSTRTEPEPLTTEQAAGVAKVQEHFPGSTPERHSKEELIAQLISIDLPKCTTLAHLAEVAGELVFLHGPVKTSPPWNAFAARCAVLKISPREAVNAAPKREVAA